MVSFPNFHIHIMKISIILDPCNDFPAFLGNARISFFYGHIQIICFFYLNIFKETLYHQNFNHSWSHFPNVAFQSYSRMLCFILMLFYFFPHIMNILVHCEKIYHQAKLHLFLQDLNFVELKLMYLTYLYVIILMAICKTSLFYLNIFKRTHYTIGF